MAQLNQVIDWGPFTELLLSTYPGLAEEGRPPNPPVGLVKGSALRLKEDRTRAGNDHHAFRRRWRRRRHTKRVRRSGSRWSGSMVRRSVGLVLGAVGIWGCCDMGFRRI
jgi:hypothetical protein